MPDTIYALSTPFGVSALGIVRLSGSMSKEILTSLIKRPLPPVRTGVVHKLWGRDGKLLDYAQVMWFKAPKSFTGEDLVELYLHGSLNVLESVLEDLGNRKGLRLAEPGEFTKRAFHSGKYDLMEAEALGDLLSARSSQQRLQALEQLEGSLSSVCQQWQQTLLWCLSRLEAAIDFVDENLPNNLQQQSLKGAKTLTNTIAAHIKASRWSLQVRTGFRIALLGQPNVGKSSIFNALTKRNAAIVSSIAGTTRDSIEIELPIGPFTVTIADTAGLQQLHHPSSSSPSSSPSPSSSSSKSLEKEAIKRTLLQAQGCDIALLIRCPGIDFPPLTKTLRNALEDSLAIIEVKNKKDLLKKTQSQLDPSPLNLPLQQSVTICALPQKGDIQPLTQAIENCLKQQTLPPPSGPLTRLRHQQVAQETLEILTALSPKMPIEAQAECLRQGIRSLDRLFGKTDTEDILEEIFSSFCIGK